MPSKSTPEAAAGAHRRVGEEPNRSKSEKTPPRGRRARSGGKSDRGSKGGNRRGSGRTAFVAILVTLGTLFGLGVTGIVLATWNNGSREAPGGIFLSPVTAQAYKNSVGSKLQVNLSDTVGLGQILGENRDPIVQIRMEILVDPSTKGSDHSWKLTLPNNATLIQWATQLDQPSPGQFSWNEGATSWRAVGSDKTATISPALYWPENASGQVQGFGLVILMVNIKVTTLSVGHVEESDQPAELWQLQWEPQNTSALDSILGTADGSLKSINWTDPFGKITTPSFPKNNYQITACPSCIPMYSYAGSTEVDKSEYAVAGYFDTQKLLSISTPAYPWSWLSEWYVWLLRLIGGPIILFWAGWIAMKSPIGHWIAEQRERRTESGSPPEENS